MVFHNTLYSMVDQYETSAILETTQIDLDEGGLQQYVEIGDNTYVGTKDGITYTLISIAENKFKLCEVSTNSNISLNSSKSFWSDSSIENNRNNTSLTPASDYKPIKLITLRRDQNVCKGQGDASGNSFISTPDSDTQFKNVRISIPEIPSPVIGEQKDGIPEIQTLTYTTLGSRKEKDEQEATLSYTVTSDSYYQVIPQVQETPRRPGRFGRPRQRMHFLANPTYPNCSPIAKPTRRGRGRGRGRGRKPRQVWYKAPMMQSTPTSTISSSYSTSGSSIPSLDVSKSLSFSSCNESQASIEYPRVPNNTPTSEGDARGKQKIFDMQQWIPQLQTRLDANYMEIDPRECHNEKERKRRLRIKNACQSMKNLLPFVSDKTDNATVFENAVNFISFVKETIGSEYDMEFLQQNCMY